MPKLTTKAVEAAKAGPARREIADDVTRGLYLIIQTSGAKSWAVRYRIEGKSIKETIGPASTLGLAEARRETERRMKLVALGTDPREHARASKQADAQRRSRTFAAVAAEFIELHAKRRNRSWRHAESVLRRDVLPSWADRPIDEIRRRDVTGLVDRIAVERPYAARLMLANVRKLFAWAMEREIIETNPAAGIKAPIRIACRDRVLSDDELRRVWQAADADGYPFGRYVQMLILTGCRRSEIAGMRWEEISGDVLTIPSERYKTGRSHVVPVSRLALEVLASVPRIEGQAHVFSGRGDVPLSGFGKRKAALATAAGVEFALHDLRRTVRTGLSRLRVPFEVAERVLGHVQGGVAAHYDHHAYLDEKRGALEAWARHIESLIRPSPVNVVKLRSEGG
ncbi:MAG: integrase arm-type DNA-binding domain-containing protein [Rhodospirillales bacterium]|nr:integrase arm-type DNA-binding domain-containing protein [Rhodospirillales bacterium]